MPGTENIDPANLTCLSGVTRGTTADPEYEAAVAVFYERHVCRVVPMPDCVVRTFAQIAANPTVYHAMNGLRVMAIDFWEKGPRYQKQMTWAVLGLTAVVMVPGTYFMLERTIRTMFGSA